jgi:hypothetical protein
MITTLKTRGVPIMWVGLPAIRGVKSTSDMSYLDELYRARADKAGIPYVDIWDGFVDDQGRYVQDGPDFEGQTRRLRTYDGVNFTKAGAEKLGHYVEHDLQRYTRKYMSVRRRGASVRLLISFVLKRERHAGTERGDLPIIYLHIHLRDLGHAQVT